MLLQINDALKPISTSGENIGDSGIIQAYRAWKAQYGSSLQDGNEYLLPGLDFTREQLFFIAFGRLWARNVKPAAAVQRIRVDVSVVLSAFLVRFEPSPASFAREIPC